MMTSKEHSAKAYEPMEVSGTLMSVLVLTFHLLSSPRVLHDPKGFGDAGGSYDITTVARIDLEGVKVCGLLNVGIFVRLTKGAASLLHLPEESIITTRYPIL